MTQYETVALIVSAIALMLTFVNIVFYVRFTSKYNKLVEEQNEISKEQNEISKEQNKIAQGQSETQVRELIITAREAVQNSSQSIADFVLVNSDKTESEAYKTTLDVYAGVFQSAQEDLRNAYEEACSRYIDGKIDRERFKRMYFKEIRRLMEDKDQQEHFNKHDSSYKCIIKVYNEWYDLEK